MTASKISRKVILSILIGVLLICGLPGISSAVDAPTVKPGDSDTQLKVQFSDFIGPFETKAYDVQVRRKTPQGDWTVGCTTITNYGGGAGSPILTIRISKREPGTTYQVIYRDTNTSNCNSAPLRPDPWSSIGEGTTSGVQKRESLKPDLVVESVRAEPATVAPGETFRLSVTVKNNGTGSSTATPLLYYRSSNNVISSNDTQVGRDSVGSVLRANRTTKEDIDLTAPTTPGTYYYGACVESVTDESDTDNNCSAAVTVTVTVTVVRNVPDLVVEAAQAVPSTVEPGEKFRLSATVKNNGAGASTETRLRYYRSTDEVITTEDTKLGRDSVSVLKANRMSKESINLKAPTTPGTYYYGACVDSITDESDTGNNCATVVRVTVTDSAIVSEDVNEDGIVDVQDLVFVTRKYGQTGTTRADVNDDGVVNIDDLILVAAVLDAAAAAPSLHSQSVEMLRTAEIKEWLSQARQRGFTDPNVRKGILFLEQLLASLIPKETSLLANYPNPFNPETWIPYQLAKDADVTLRIYAVDGQMVRRVAFGHQPAGMYQNRSRAAYWDGRNAFGEPVASGIYFYTLTAGDFTATRKMLIRK